MKVFMSWSGDQSRELAEALSKWLESVLQSVRIYFSPTSVEKGTQWFNGVSRNLEEAKIAILVLDRSNLNSEWLHFEAGAVSKGTDQNRVCAIAFGIKKEDIKGPLSQFQASEFNKVELLQLLETLNNQLGENKLKTDVLNNVFEIFWPRLDKQVESILNKDPNSETSIRAEPRSEFETDVKEIKEIVTLLARRNSFTRENRQFPDRVTIDLLSGIEELINVTGLADQELIDNIVVLEVFSMLQRPINYIAHSGKGEVSDIARRLIRKLEAKESEGE